MTDSKTAKKIEVVPCQQHFGSYIVSERGVDYQIQRWPLWPITTKCCGTEAEAQAKKEELELAAACKEIAEVSQAKRAAQPTETRPPDERKYPCADCGVMRSQSEGGTTFTVCDECFDKRRAAASLVARPQQPCVNCGKVTNNKHCAVNNGLHVYEPAAARVEQPTPPDDVWKDCQPQVLQLDSMKFNAYFRYDVEAKCWVWWVPAIGKYTQARDRADIGPVHSLIRNYCELDVHLPATHADYEKFCAAPVVAQRELDVMIDNEAGRMLFYIERTMKDAHVNEKLAGIKLRLNELLAASQRTEGEGQHGSTKEST